MCANSHSILTDILKRSIKIDCALYNKPDLRLVTHLLTGHCYLGKHQYNIKNINSDVCTHCKLGSESVSHFLGYCPKFAQIRRKYLGLYYGHFDFIFRIVKLLDIIRFMKAAYSFPLGYYQGRPP